MRGKTVQFFRVTDHGDGVYSGSSSGRPAAAPAADEEPAAAAEEDASGDGPPAALTRCTSSASFLVLSCNSQELLRGGGTCAGDGDLGGTYGIA